MMNLQIRSTLQEQIIQAQRTDESMQKIRNEIYLGKAPGFMVHEDDAIRFQGRLCVPNHAEPKRRIMEKAQRFSRHKTQNWVSPSCPPVGATAPPPPSSSAAAFPTDPPTLSLSVPPMPPKSSSHSTNSPLKIPDPKISHSLSPHSQRSHSPPPRFSYDRR